MRGRLRAVKSEVNNRYYKRNIQIHRARTPLRFSRRLRQLPPEDIKFYCSIRNLKKQLSNHRQILSQKSSTNTHCECGKRKIHYQQRVKNSKEIISILSAPKICNKTHSTRRFTDGPIKVRSGSRPKTIVRSQKSPHSFHLDLLKNIKKEYTDTEKLIDKRKKYVLDVLNKGDMKDIGKLPSIGLKTAERIILFRQLKGAITKISELAKMPKFPKQKFNNFIEQNFLKSD